MPDITVDTVLETYDRSFADFARPWHERDAREMRKLYLKLMEQRPQRIDQFQRLLRAMGVDDELTWTTRPQIVAGLAPLVEGQYRVSYDPADDFPTRNVYGDVIYPPPHMGKGKRVDFGTAEVDLDAPWDAIAIDWGIFVGEAYRSRYPSMYWVLVSGSPKNPGRYVPTMVAMPNQPVQKPFPAVYSSIDALQGMAVEGRSWVSRRWRLAGSEDQVAERAEAYLKM